MTPTNEQLLAAINENHHEVGACVLLLLLVLVVESLTVVFQIVLGMIQIKQANYTAALLLATKNVGQVNEQRREDAKQALSRIEDKVEQGSAEARAAKEKAEASRLVAVETAKAVGVPPTALVVQPTGRG